MKTNKTLLCTALMVVVLYIIGCKSIEQSGKRIGPSLEEGEQGEIPIATEPIKKHGPGYEQTTTLVENFRTAGADVQYAGKGKMYAIVEQPFFSVIGTLLKINGEDVQVFEYQNKEAAEEEASKVSSDGSSVGTTMITWALAPHFYKKGRIIVLYGGDNEKVLEVLELVMGRQFAGSTEPYFKDGKRTFQSDFQTIAKEDGMTSGVKEQKQLVIDNQEDWQRLWHKIHEGIDSMPPRPWMAFPKQVVIAVFQGMKGSGGYSIEIINVTYTARLNKVTGLLFDVEFEVIVKEISPGKGCMVTEVITSPYHIISMSQGLLSLEDLQEKLKFKMVEETHDCE